ncbi:hypothetical protein C8J56DRAFT_1132341 [Mycena floridula]|nr:hypothetical protein C8J56DRAFT_1132341 [Mycena floridula]
MLPGEVDPDSDAEDDEVYMPPPLPPHRLYARTIHKYMPIMIGTPVRFEVFQPPDDDEDHDADGDIESDDPDAEVEYPADDDEKYSYGVVIDIRCEVLAEDGKTERGLRFGISELWRQPIDPYDDKLVSKVMPVSGNDKVVRLIATSMTSWVSAGAIRAIPKICFARKKDTSPDPDGFLVTHVYYPDMEWKVAGTVFPIHTEGGQHIWPWYVTGVHDTGKPAASAHLFPRYDETIRNTPNQGAKQKKESNAEKEQREKAKEASENGVDFNED